MISVLKKVMRGISRLAEIIAAILLAAMGEKTPPPRMSAWFPPSADAGLVPTPADAGPVNKAVRRAGIYYIHGRRLKKITGRIPRGVRRTRAPHRKHASEMEQYNGTVVFDGIQECAKACLANGIPVGLGTDTGCPYITHYDMWRELYYFHKYCGVSNAFALYTATRRNAGLVGLEGVTGSVESGRCADLIVTRENPLEDLRALRNVDMVMARGRLISAPKVRKMPEVEQELDKFL